MRTVLYGICLLINNMIMHDKVYICNQTMWGESKIAERQRKREAENCWKWEMAGSINLIIGENIYGRFGRVIWNNQDAANDCFPRLTIFSLVICRRHFVWPTSRKSCILVHFSWKNIFRLVRLRLGKWVEHIRGNSHFRYVRIRLGLKWA